MIHVFQGATADEVWSEAAARFENSAAVLHQPSRIGNTLELLHTTLSIRDPRQRWVLSRYPAMNPAFAIAEVVWIIAGRNDSAFINHWNPALPRFAGEGDVYHGAYGHRLRRNFGFDQLESAFLALQSNPVSRQVVLQIWDASLDLPGEGGAPRDPDIPCNICSMIKVREGKLDWMQVLRSNDLFLGVPHNIVQFTSLQEVVAGWLGIEVGTYHQLSDSLHIYERDISKIRQRSKPESHRNPDSLMLPKMQSEQIWGDIAHRMFLLASTGDLSIVEWRKITDIEGPEAFRNLFSVVAADDARRRGWTNCAEEAMKVCTNPALIESWRNWTLRTSPMQVVP
jgi:thymidylate synthase